MSIGAGIVPELVLASKSASRRTMLDQAGLAYRAQPAELDERGIEQSLGEAAPDIVARALAEAKAFSVSKNAREALVIGSDSLVSVSGRRFDKPQSREEAAGHLQWFSGKCMELHSAAALARDGSILWAHSDVARLYVREFPPEFIERYLEAEWPEVGHCAGVFRIEGLGAHLFERIEGSYFTVLGMPLLPLLGALRQHRIDF